MAVDAAKAFDLDICGVDILFKGNDAYTVCEVNALPGFKSLEGTILIIVSLFGNFFIFLTTALFF